MRSILNRFMDGMAGVKIAVNVFLDEADYKPIRVDRAGCPAISGESLWLRAMIPEGELLDVRAPASASKE